MEIQENSHVSLEYTLTSDAGEVIDSTSGGEPLTFVYGHGQLIPGFEDNLLGRSQGERIEFSLAPADAYGEVREELRSDLPRKNFPDDMAIEPGMLLQAMGPMGPMRFRVLEVLDDKVVVDFNHPLAGQRLHFDVRIGEVRAATAEEIEALSCDEGHECTHCGKH
jgi:FKBP-type peptidyl-prolyl cis-trans isomerase SlyD